MLKKANTVFLVDDNLKNIQVAANVLRLEGYKVLFSDNGKEGLKNIELYMPDIILLDIMMPIMDGFEVCKLLKENDKTRNIPVIFLTAKTEVDNISKGLELGGVDYITKPFNPKELIARLKTHLTIQNQKKELTELNETKDKLFSVMGHDLKGNVASILSLSGLLLDHEYEKSEDQRYEFYRYIHNQANNLNILLTNLLNWSKSRSDKMVYDPRPVDVKRIAEQNVRLLKENASLKNIKLISAVEVGFDVMIDENMINTVLRNLIFNAIKFTNVGGSITIDAEKRDGMAYIKVTDTGVGIRKEKQNTIFNRETVVSTNGTAEETGTGLGLSICNDFVAKNKGKIWLESEPGKGTTVYFSVPLPVVE